MGKLHPVVWLGAGALSVLLLGVVYMVGMFAAGKDVEETCAGAGHPLDAAYRQQHWQEPGQFFPLHDRCDAGFDLVPVWVNPSLVVLAVLAIAGLAGGVVAALARRAKEAA